MSALGKRKRQDEPASIEAEGAEIRSCFWAPMAATLWSTLPDELLQQIFARLPPRDIIRLQCLSKKWQWILTSRDSGFKRACAVASPRMFAMVKGENPDGSISVNMYNIKANRLHLDMHQLCHNDYIHHLFAGDGGLVCVISPVDFRDTPLITVFNPLDPGKSRVLPHDALRGLEPQMVQLVMDRDRRCYKVLVVGEKSGHVVAKIFSSETGAWDGEEFEGLVFGHRITWDHDYLEDDRAGPCAYDSVGRQLLELVDGSHPCHYRTSGHLRNGGVSSLCYALVEDHLFVLHEETYVQATNMVGRRYCIWEYRGQKCEPHWIKLKMHRCKGFECPPTTDSYEMSLYACKGFLIVKAETEESLAYRLVLTWLYDMVTEKWQAVSPSILNSWSDFTIELQWDAIP